MAENGILTEKLNQEPDYTTCVDKERSFLFWLCLA